MKKLAYLILLCVIQLNLHAQDTTYFDANWKSTASTNASYFRVIKKEPKLYAVTDYYITGEIQFIGKTRTISEDALIMEGTATWYNKDGTKDKIANFINNIPNGEAKTFYNDGKIKTSAQYNNSKPTGNFIEYFPGGYIANQRNFKDGLLDGAFTKYKSPNNLDFKMHYKSGSLNGTYEIYNANNRIFMKGNAKNNLQEGLCQEYFYEGGLRCEYKIKDKLLDGLYLEFNSDNDTTTIGNFSNGKVLNFTSQNLNITNGSKFSAKMKLDGTMENWTIFRDGKIIVEAVYTNGKKTDLWKVYNFNGTKLLQTIDFGKNALCQEQYLQETKNEFAPHFSFSNRFKFNADILDTRDCGEVIINNSDAAANEANPFSYIKPTKKNTENSSFDESKVLDYVDPTNRPAFILKNKIKRYTIYDSVFICKKEIDKIVYKVVLCKEIEILKKIKQSVQPKINEIYFFYQQFASGTYDFKIEKKIDRYMAFTISKPLQELFKSKTLDYITVIGVYEHEFWNIDDFSGMSAYDAFKKEMKSVATN